MQRNLTSDLEALVNLDMEEAMAKTSTVVDFKECYDVKPDPERSNKEAQRLGLDRPFARHFSN